MAFRHPDPARRPPVRAYEDGVPVFNFGYASVYAAAPTLTDDRIWQEGSEAAPRKIALKSSAEITDNLLGVCTTRMPRLPEHDEQTLEACHLIDGDDTTCWAGYPHSRPDDRPVWIRVDLARTAFIETIELAKRRLTFDRDSVRGSYKPGGGCEKSDPRFNEIGRSMARRITIKTAVDGAVWTERFCGDVDTQSAETFSFAVGDRVKQIYIEGTQLELCENFCYMFSIACVRALAPDGTNQALLSRGASVIASSAHHLGQCELECTDWYWPMHFDLGVKWSRIGYHDDMINWHWVERERGVLAVDPKADASVSELHDNGVNVIMCLNFGNRLYEGYNERRFPQLPEWYYETPYPPRSDEALAAWDRYVTYMAEHFADRVTYFEIWNEWNGEGYWGDIPDTDLYLKIAKRTIPILRREAPGTRIMLGSYAGFTHGSRPETDDGRHADFYRAIEELAPLVDAIGFHPFYQPDITGEDYNRYPENFAAFKEYCEDCGFRGGVYMASEYAVCAWTPPFLPGTPGLFWKDRVYTDIQKAKVVAQISVMNTALGITSVYCELSQTNFPLDNSLLFTGWETYPSQASNPAPAYYVTRNLCTVLDGCVPDSFCAQVSRDDLFVFAMRRGRNRLLALWQRNTAADECEGVPVDITLPFESGSASALNCMDGEVSLLHITTADGITKAAGVIVRDYPLLIEFEI